MDRILKILKKENAPRASSAPALELNTIIFKHVYGYMQQISGERLQDHWSSGYFLSHFLMKFLCANRIAPDGTPRSAAIHLGFTICLCPTKGTPGLYELR